MTRLDHAPLDHDDLSVVGPRRRPRPIDRARNRRAPHSARLHGTRRPERVGQDDVAARLRRVDRTAYAARSSSGCARRGATRRGSPTCCSPSRRPQHLLVTAREVVALARSARHGVFGRLDRTDRAAIDDALERLEISHLANRHLAEMSGGQRQRVFIAQGLAQGAEVLLLDEPVAGLDLASLADDPSGDRRGVCGRVERSSWRRTTSRRRAAPIAS